MRTRAFLLFSISIFPLSSFAGNFICPQKMTCDLSIDHGGMYAKCQNVPNGWKAALSSYSSGTAPLPATVTLYFISAQHTPMGAQSSNCNYYQKTAQGGFYNVILSSYGLAFPDFKAPTSIWQFDSSAYPVPISWCYSPYNNSPTTESNSQQCPFNE